MGYYDAERLMLNAEHRTLNTERRAQRRKLKTKHRKNSGSPAVWRDFLFLPGQNFCTNIGENCTAIGKSARLSNVTNNPLLHILSRIHL